MKYLIILLAMLIFGCSKETPTVSQKNIGECYKYYAPPKDGVIINKIDSIEYFGYGSAIKYTYAANVGYFYHYMTSDKTGLGIFKDTRSGSDFLKDYPTKVSCDYFESLKKEVKEKIKLREIKTRLEKLEAKHKKKIKKKRKK